MLQHCVHSFNVNYFICSFSDDYDNDGDDNMVLLLALESTSPLVSCSQAYKKIKYKKINTLLLSVCNIIEILLI